MSTEETKKHWIALAPSILTGLAALIAALTTVYINVRNDKSAPAAAVQVATVPVPVPNNVAVVSNSTMPVQAKVIDLQLERMRVDNDGSMGTTDWTFEIQNGERSLFSVPFKALADNAGENIVVPKDAAVAHAKLAVTENMPEIIVRGWKQGWSSQPGCS